MKFDKDTSEVLQEGKHYANIVKSDDWQELRALLEAKMTQLYLDVDVNKPSDILGQDVKANQKAIRILEEFIGVIEGGAYQFHANSELILDTPDLYNRS